jgi:hypothetical protein
MYFFRILRQYGTALRRIGSSTVIVGAQKCERMVFTVCTEKKNFFGKVQKSTGIERQVTVNSNGGYKYKRLLIKKQDWVLLVAIM